MAIHKKNKTKEKKAYVSTGKIIFGSLAIMLIITFQVIGKDLSYNADRISDYMNITLNSEIKRTADDEEIHKTYDELISSTVDFMLDYCEFYLDEYGVTKANINYLGQYLSSNVYFISGLNSIQGEDELHITKANESDDYWLSDEQTMTLIEKHTMELTGEDGYSVSLYSRPFKTGYIVVSDSWEDFDSAGINLGSVHPSYDEEMLFWLDENGVITSSSDDSYVGNKIDDITNIYGKDDIKLMSFVGSGVGVAKFVNYKERTLIVYLPMVSLLLDVFRGAVVPIILFWVVVLTILIYALKIRKDKLSEDNINKQNIIAVSKKILLNREIVSHIVALGIFGMILIGTSIFYVRALISYSDQNILASTNLKRLSESYNANQNNQEKELENIQNELFSNAQVIMLGYMSHPGTLDSASLVRLAQDVSLVDDIAVLDGTGTIIASTTNEEGYTLGRNDYEINTFCWAVLEGEMDDGIVLRNINSDGSYEYSAVFRRQDAKGVVIVQMVQKNIARYLDKWGLKETILTADIGEATCMAVEEERPDCIYMAVAGAQEVTTLDATISEEILSNGFAGTRWIKGIKYYINTLHNAENDIIFISALPVRNIPYLVALKSVISIFLGLILFIVFLSLTVGMRPVNEELTEASMAFIQKRLFDRESIINEEFKRVFSDMIVATGILLVLLLGLDYFFEDQPLLRYLFGSQWNKGVNLFSLTMILIIMVGGTVLGFVLDKLILMICNNMGPRGMTIGHLLGSLSRFIIFVVTVIWSLKELGFNLSALLTGAGIAGAAISLCANSTINDLLSGFFIVFEGAFQIGDWIKVGDWRGQVLEIGMRTTKIGYGDSIKIVNNSTMTNVTIMDPTNSGALMRFEIAYKEDAARVIELINSNQKLYCERIPEIEDGPYVKGVVDLGLNGVAIEVYAYGNQAYVARMERGMRLVTKEIFDANNIEIPFNQITIHQADETRHFK